MSLITWIARFLTMAGWTVLVYDYLLTFDLEVRVFLFYQILFLIGRKVDYIWRAPWTPVKAIFLLNRYGTLIAQSSLMIEELGVLSHGSEKVFLSLCC